MNVVYIFRDANLFRVPFFDYDKQLYKLCASFGGGVWDKSRREFIFNRAQNTEQFRRILSNTPCVEVNEAPPISLSIFNFLVQQNAAENEPEPILDVLAPKRKKPDLPEHFTENWQNKLETELRARKYSKKTQSIYLYFNRLFCNSLQKTPQEIEPQDISTFLGSIEKSREYSASTINLAFSALRFFYKRVLKIDIAAEQRRPRQDKKLPVVLSASEVVKMFETEKNIKHRLLLMMVYASGLRVSEAVKLKRKDIDMERKTVFISSGKGRTDRYTTLSDTVYSSFSRYFTKFDIDDWIFPSTNSAKHLTVRSAQRIFEKAAKKSGIVKDTSIHSLRHSFATHLLESGTDIRYIQGLLGHSSIKTTERYTHVAHCKVNNITSPIDLIKKEG